MLDTVSPDQASSLLITKTMLSSTKRAGRRKLAADFVPGKGTVVCGRGHSSSRSTGNQYLKTLIASYTRPYSKARNKNEKTAIVSSIVATINRASPEGGFVKFEHGAWWEVQDSFAREKVGCLFRDILHDKYRSSTKSKLARKLKAKEKEQEEPRGESIATTTTTCSSSTSCSSNIVNTGQRCFATQLAEHTFGSVGFDQVLSFPNASAAQNGRFPNSSVSSSKISDYCALFSNYVGQSPAAGHSSRSSLPDMLREGTPSFFTKRRGAPLSAISAVREAFDLVGGGFLEEEEVDDLPDDISDIFD